VKICGLTRREDAAAARGAGAAYLGVIFAGGPRLLTAEGAGEVLAGAGEARRVGVFGAATPEEIGRIAHVAGLDVVQLHADPGAADVEAARSAFGGQVWAALRVRGVELPPHAAELFAVADGVVVDAHVPGALGGTGVSVAWEALGESLARMRAVGRALFVLAGGLTPQNVTRAIGALAPDVVDVSSGVERAPGIKDHSLLRAFGDAVRTSRKATSRP
jgi:phosphoribosylanthranilate isomerase